MATHQITKFEKCLLFLLFFELFAGGGGRFFAFGPLSIRQFLFILLFITFAIRFIRSRDTRKEILSYFSPPKLAVVIVPFLLGAWILVSAFIGIAHHNAISLVATDVLRVIYLITILPLIYYVGEKRFSRKNLVTTLMVAGLVISIITITIGLIGKSMNVDSFYYFYQDINHLFPADLYFRPSRGVFHKSHFLVLFAVIVASVNIIERNAPKLQYFVLLFGSISLILSETRGLFIGYAIGLFVYILTNLVIYIFGDRTSLVINKKMMVRRIVFLVIALSVTGFFFKNSTIARFSNDEPSTSIRNKNKNHRQRRPPEEINDESFNVRILLMNQSLKIIESSKTNALLGNGYGTVIAKRKGAIEMSLVDIWVEQGIVGVVLWVSFTLLPLYYYFRYFLIRKRLDNLSIALMACTLAMLAITNINPFLNSPIGMGFLVPVIVLAFKRFNSAKSILPEVVE